MNSFQNIDCALNKIGLGRFHIIMILILGITLSSEASEMLILAVLGPIFICQWRINVIENSFLTTGLFLGLMIGSVMFGSISDKQGRKPTLLIGSMSLVYFALLAAGSPTIIWMIVIRFLIGLFAGSHSPSLNALLVEVTPINFRGPFMITLQLFWAFGSYFITILCLTILPLFGWRVLLIITAIPIFCVSLALFWIPESPRILLLKNEKIKCIAVLNRIAKMNQSEYVEDIVEKPNDTPSSFRDLIHPDYLRTFILTSYLWLVCGMLYFSLILLITIINGIPHRCLQDWTTFSSIPVDNSNKTIDNSCCQNLNWVTYKSMLVSTTAEIIFVPISFILIHLIGRKIIMCIYLTATAIGIILLNLCLSPLQLNVLLFFLRGSIGSLYNFLYIYTAEVFPTSVRSLAIGFGNGISKFGAMLSPVIVNFIIAKLSFFGGTLTLFILIVLGLVAVFFIRYETKDRELYQTAGVEIVEPVFQFLKKPINSY